MNTLSSPWPNFLSNSKTLFLSRSAIATAHLELRPGLRATKPSSSLVAAKISCNTATNNGPNLHSLMATTNTPPKVPWQ
ncbi:hypothetical protein ACB092_12G008300 [Castanea dentata]